MSQIISDELSKKTLIFFCWRLFPMWDPMGFITMKKHNLGEYVWFTFSKHQTNQSKNYTPRKLTCQWQIPMFNRRYIFKRLFLHRHVSFQGCIPKNMWEWSPLQRVEELSASKTWWPPLITMFRYPKWRDSEPYFGLFWGWVFLTWAVSIQLI